MIYADDINIITTNTATQNDTALAAATIDETLKFGVGTYEFGQIEIPDNIMFVGEDIGLTTLKAKDNLDDDFIIANNKRRPGLIDITIDGNRANQTAGRAAHLHPWQSSSSINRLRHACYASGSGVVVDNSHFESGGVNCLEIDAIQAQFSNCFIYSPDATADEMCKILSESVHFSGVTIKGNGSIIDLQGLVIGDEFSQPDGCNIQAVINWCKGGMINPTYSGGSNIFSIAGNNSNTNIVGEFHSSDSVVLRATGGTPNSIG